MKDILNHTQSYDYNWANQLKSYEFKHSHLPWEHNPLPPRVTTKMVKQNDKCFNLILQKYNDKEYEKSLNQKEKKDLVETIIKNQDKQLKVEQTFNIINLQDRLKGFENHPDYPKQKDLINKRKKINYDVKNYNIISNLPLTVHHYDKPENRPKLVENEKKNVVRKNKQFLFGNQERDYDIISTKYKCYHDEKVKLDKELSKLNTARKFYGKNDYNPIKGAYFNQEKEEQYQKMLQEKINNWGKEKFENMPKCAKGRCDIYDLISLNVVDKKAFNKMVTEERNQKKRYELRSDMDKYYHELDLKRQDKEISKFNFKSKKYKENTEKIKNISKGKLFDWEKIINGASNNNTFSTKSIYRDPYEKSDVVANYDKFKLVRNKTLSELPKISEDKNFERKKRMNKCQSYQEIKRNVMEIKSDFDKEKFFNMKPKDVDLKKYKYVNTNKNIRKKDKEFLLNKEKNEKREQKMNFNFDTQPENNKN